MARWPLRRCTFDELGSLAAASRRRWRIFQQSVRRIRLRHKTSAWASGGPTEGRCLAGEEQLGSCVAEKSKNYQSHLYSDKVTFAAMAM
jgi:hypothetical protein